MADAPKENHREPMIAVSFIPAITIEQGGKSTDVGTSTYVCIEFVLYVGRILIIFA